MLHASGPLDESLRCTRVSHSTWTDCTILGDVPIAIMRCAQPHRPNVGRCATCRIGHFSRSSTRRRTRRITSSQRSRCKSHRRMEQSHAACIFMTVEHCKSASANFAFLQRSGATAVTCPDVVSSQQQQRQRGKPELSMTKSHRCDSNPGVQCYARQLVSFIARKRRLCKTQAPLHWTMLHV